MKKVITLLVCLAVIGLAYVSVMSIYTPVQFDKEQTKREVVLQRQLKQVVTFQQAYEDVHGRYATAQELEEFLSSGRVFYIRAEGEYTDAMRERGLSEVEAARQGLIVRDTIWVAAQDSLLKGNQKPISELFAFSFEGQASGKILIDTASIEQVVGKDTIFVPVFQAVVPFDAYLSDLDEGRRADKKEAAEKKANGYAGLRVGSLKEVKTTGNWE